MILTCKEQRAGVRKSQLEPSFDLLSVTFLKTIDCNLCPRQPNKTCRIVVDVIILVRSSFRLALVFSTKPAH